MIKERYKALTLTAKYGIFVNAKAIVAQCCIDLIRRISRSEVDGLQNVLRKLTELSGLL
jgi:hypothetical protein